MRAFAQAPSILTACDGSRNLPTPPSALSFSPLSPLVGGSIGVGQPCLHETLSQMDLIVLSLEEHVAKHELGDCEIWLELKDRCHLGFGLCDASELAVAGCQASSCPIARRWYLQK